MAGLSEKARRVLAGLADGHSVEQILAWDLTLRYGDVAEAAREALALAEGTPPKTVEERRQGHARAYEPWTAEEEGRLREMVGVGQGIEEMAAALGRQPSAVRSRLVRLGLAVREP